MFPSLALAALVAFAPAQAGALNFTNVRNTYGQMGPTRASSKFLPGDILFIAYEIEGMTIAEDGRTQYSTQLELCDKDGKSLNKFEPRDALDFIPLGGGRIPAQAYVTIGVDQPPGEYLAKIYVVDKTAKVTKTLERKFEVTAPDFGIVNIFASTDKSGSNPTPTTGVVSQTIYVYFSVVGFKREGDKNQPKLHVEMTTVDEAGKPTLGKPVVYDIVQADEKIPTYPFIFSLPMTRPGKFAVRLSCTDKITGKTATLDLPVLVLAADK